MAVIMVEVPEAASRLDEMVDAVLAGEQVVLTRNDEPVGMLVSFDNPGRTEGPCGTRRGPVESPEERAAPSRPYHDIILVRRRLTVIAYMP